MIFVMLAGLRCSDAFFSYRTVPVCASIKRTDGRSQPKVRCHLRCCLLRLFCFLFRCFVLLLVGRFSILLCRSHFQGAVRSARIISRLQTIFRVLLFIFPRNICSFFPTGYADDRRTMLSVPFTAAVPETSAHRGVHGLQNFSFGSSPY